MKSKAAKKLLLVTTLVSAVAIPGSNALAQYSGDINYIETSVPSQSTGVTINSDPVVTAILSAPGTVNGRTYTSWAFLVNDGTGSMEVYGSSPLLGGYTPPLGDAITPTGEYYPYHQIPELETLTALSLVSQGNSYSPVAGVSTILTLNQATLPYSVAGYLWTLDDVTISGISGSFGTANQTGTITDATGSMTLYYWPTSYSVENANLDGMAIPTGPVNMTGFVSVYSGTAEFTPISITSVPEPGTLALGGMGGLLLALVLRRRNV